MLYISSTLIFSKYTRTELNRKNVSIKILVTDEYTNTDLKSIDTSKLLYNCQIQHSHYILYTIHDAKYFNKDLIYFNDINQVLYNIHTTLI